MTETTILDILARPDIRELRRAVQQAYADMQEDGRYADGLYATADRVQSYPGETNIRVDMARDVRKDAVARWGEANAAYSSAVNEACMDAGLEPYITGRRMSLADAAELLGVRPDTLRNQIHNGALRAEKIGRNWTVDSHEIERYRRHHLGNVGRPRTEQS